MLKLSRSTFLFLGTALLTFIAGMLALAPRLLLTDGFEPHGYCFLWQPGLLWLLVGSDFLIGTAYVAISCTLAYLVYQTRHDIPFRWMLLAFGAFIIACGFTHFLDVYTVWIPVYWLAGNVKLVTAMASVATAVALPPLVPRVLHVIDTAKISQERKRQLELANTELELLYTKIKELDELKSQFFANVSHELRTPLTLILGPTQQLLAAGGLDDGQRHTLGVVERNAQTLLKHVNDLNVNYRNISGMGIGLYIVKEIVTRHGGWVEVQSAEGHGSTFRVFLPVPDVDDLFNNRDARAKDEEQQHEYLGGR